MNLARGFKTGEKDTASVIKNALEATKKAFKDYDAELEKNITLALLKFYRENAEPDNYLNNIGDFKSMNLEEYTETLFKNSVFASLENFGQAGEKTLDQLKSDPSFIS